ncbi:MAG TPA: hypothetical protein VHH73_08125, partial [Verrucomicrobiae bacterium]|nr:hypothetical protein [Verrucomicrobiae bacterium]
LIAICLFFSRPVFAQEALPAPPNPYATLGIPSGPYSAGVGNTVSSAPDNPIPGFVNGEVNPLILGWAAEVVDYSPANPSAIDAYWKNLDTLLHPVSGNVFDVVSLGDLSAADITKGVAPGSLTVKFDQPVGDGPGPDIVIFGNAFQLAKSTRVFAKLAYVEVSTDGVLFARFPSVDTNPRPAGAGWPYITSDATKIYNLFGKAVNAYGPSWGNPFDLHDLALHPLAQNGAVNLQNIRYVRLVAIPGSGSYQDSFGNPIYCPWPTYGSPGPEVQAVGLLNRGQVAEKDPVPHPKSSTAAKTTPAAPPAPRIYPRSPGTTALSPAGGLLDLRSAFLSPEPIAAHATLDDTTADSSAADDAKLSAEVAATLAGKARGPRRTANQPPSLLPSLTTPPDENSISRRAEYHDQSLYPSGVQARLNSFHPTLWGRTVQRVAYLTGWELTPASLIAILGGGFLALILAAGFLVRKKISDRSK